MKLTDFTEEFKEALEHQLTIDDTRWGDTWRKRPKEGQIDRTMARIQDYYDQYKNGNRDFDIMKAIGNLYICWVRENVDDWELKDDNV